MTLRELIECNKDWEESTNLLIVSKNYAKVSSMTARACCSSFGQRRVLWFRDCVVMFE